MIFTQLKFYTPPVILRGCNGDVAFKFKAAFALSPIGAVISPLTPTTPPRFLFILLKYEESCKYAGTRNKMEGESSQLPGYQVV